MKKVCVLAVFLCILALFSPVQAETFAESFNFYAEHVYGLAQMAADPDDLSGSVFTAPTYRLAVRSGEITIRGSAADALDVLTAACCALRVVDNAGSSIDQYGRVMHAYFMARSRDPYTEYRATTENGFLVYVKLGGGSITVRLVG